MKVQEMSGQLRARLEIPSYRLSQNLPIIVRDSKLSLVGQIRDNEALDLDPGWYEVSAVLNDGQRHAETVQISAGDMSEITLRVDPDKLMPTSYMAPAPDGYSLQARVLSEHSHDLDLLEVHGAKLEGEESNRLVFAPEDDTPVSVPYATLQLIDERLRISLPVNPRGWGELATSVMTSNSTDSGTRIRTGFHPDRIVSTAVLNMLENSQFAQATAAVEATAEDMLMDKYQDPVGAALGAIIMYRAGTLGRRLSWLNNLQRDFDWLPDGKILMAAELGDSDPETAADLLIRASQQRPLFTESFSILFDALRRWSSTHRADEISAAFRDVAGLARRVDWSALTYTDREA